MTRERMAELCRRHFNNGGLHTLEIEELLEDRTQEIGKATLQLTIGEWAARTFPGTPKERMTGVVNHLAKEVEELRETVLWSSNMAAPGDWVAQSKLEAADCLILLFNLAHFMGFDLMEAVQTKHAINVKRTWKQPDKDGVCQHVEEAVR